jgi:hypothetical protein
MAVLMDHPDLARAMGMKGRSRCRELFNVDKTSASLCEILSEHGAFTTRRANIIHAFFRRTAA